MESKYSREQLNALDKSALVEIVLSYQDALDMLNRKMDKLLEQMAIANNARFGRSSESGIIDENQISFFNEAEAFADKSLQEPEIETVVKSYARRMKGQLDEDLSGFPVKEILHELSSEELETEFPNGYTRLDDEVYRKLEYHPSWHEVLEHHIAVYKDSKSKKIVKAKHPVEMLDHSIATPSLAAAIMNAKYTNAMPLYRIESELSRNAVTIRRQTMANWMILLSERYLSLVYDRLKTEILNTSVIHADETPVMVTKDGREGMHKNYMWVYRTGEYCKANPAIIYDYQKTRKQDHPKEFLKGFRGNLVCDGYQVYHNIDSDDALTVAGCWAHARRPFAEVVKAVGEEKAKGTVAYDALSQIANIYHTDNALLKLPPSERKKKRKLLVKPLVEAFFKWVKEQILLIAPNSKTAEGLGYCINQEKYLRAFLNNPQIPMDNNAAERAIRSFCVGKKNWQLIDTVNGAEASAIIYSIVETAKANNLKVYDYLRHLLNEIPQHMDDTNLDFLGPLMPWSTELPKELHKEKGPNQ